MITAGDFIKMDKSRIVGVIKNAAKRFIKFKPKRITKITVEYFKNPNNPSDAEYTERLTIDANSVEISQIFGDNRKITHKYESEEDAEFLLDFFSEENLFADAKVKDALDENVKYTISISYENGKTRCFSGSFNKYGLPDDYPEFARAIFCRISLYRLGDILDSSVYEKKFKRNSEYIYCSVAFDSGYTTYYYITNDDSIEENDCVTVPAGVNNRTTIARVVKKEYFKEEDVPYPLDKTKRIICKYDEKDDCEFDDEY